jgi:hypothetical protein
MIDVFVWITNNEYFLRMIYLARTTKTVTTKQFKMKLQR